MSLALVVGASVATVAPGPAAAADIKVDNLNDAGPGSLRDAVDKANATTELDVIVFNSALNGTLTLTSGAIGIDQNVVIDASDAGEILISGDDSSRIFTVLDAELTIVRLGLTRGNGNAGGAIYAEGDVTLRSSVISSSSSGDQGGAIYATGDVTITGSEVKDNSAEYGGGIYAGDVVIETGSRISDNRAVRGGGGVWAEGGVAVRDSSIVDNTACTDGDNYNAGGGGVFVASAPATISGSTISGNTCATKSGGALQVFSDTALDIDDTVFSDNAAAHGGAIRVADSVVATIDGGDFDGNTSDFGGGAISATASSLSITDSTFDTNTATDGPGGAVALEATDATVTGSSFSDNVSGISGGGIDTFDSDLGLTNTSFTRNAASFGGGAVSVYEAAVTTTGGNFTSNRAEYGGAMNVVLTGDMVVDGTRFVGNEATAAEGGGLTVFPPSTPAATLDVSGAVFEDNISAADGGAVFVNPIQSAVFTEVSAFDNSATGAGGAFRIESPTSVTFDGGAVTGNTASSGGGLSVIGASVAISGTDISDNAASVYGGGVEIREGHLGLADSTFTSNTSGLGGGAVHGFDASLTAADSDFESNASPNGGAIDVALDGELRLERSTFARNRATAADGGAVNARGLSFGGSSEVVVDTVVFTDNTAERGGGAFWSFDLDDATFTDVTATGNEAGGRGGAFVLRVEGEVDFEGGAVSNNTAPTGGGIYAQNTDLDIESTTLSGNTATDGDGGAVSRGSSIDSSLSINNSIVSDNRAPLGSGGAIDALDVSIDTSFVSDNAAGDSGGAVDAVQAFIDRSTFADNEAGGDGGAIHTSGALVADDSTFSANSAVGQGGALATEGGNNYLFHVTITGNSAGVSGGGAHNDSARVAAVGNSIIAGNQAPVAPDIEMLVAPRYSIIGDIGPTPFLDEDGRPEVGLLIGVGPLLGPLADNGGTTLTHALMPRSPAIDLGRVPQTAPRSDQRGVIRDVGRAPDAGAFEYDGPLPVWIPVTPARLADTRSTGETVDGRFRAAGLVPGGQFVEIDIAGRGGVPENASSAVVNVTAIRPSATGFLTVFPCTETRPNASSVNYTTGVNLPNEVAAGLSAAGSICVYSKEDTHISVDVVGYVPSTSPFVPVEPGRLLDTRDTGVTVDGRFRADGRRAGRSELKLAIGGRYGIPADAAAVVVNVTAVRPSDRGFLTVHRCVGERPLSSSLNYIAGGNRANEILAGLDDDGNLCIYTHVDTDVLVDVVGYLPAGTDLTPVEPARVFETRTTTSTVDGQFAGGGKLPAGSTTRVQIAGRAGVGDDAISVNINVTAVAASRRGFVTVFPCGERPLAASLNYIPGVNGGNDLIAGLDDDGGLCIYNLSETHLTIDIAGYTTL